MRPREASGYSVVLVLLAWAGSGAEAQEPHEALSCDEWVRTPAVYGGGIPHCGPWVRDGYVSIQVNVDKRGCNIVGDAGNEPSVALDSNDPRRIAIGWRQFDSVESSFRQAGFGYTRDAGRSWMFPGTLESGVEGSDPVLMAAPDSAFYYSTISITIDATRLFLSEDGGMTWAFRSHVYPSILDKPWMTVDQTSGIGRGNIYFSGQGRFLRSINAGESFTLEGQFGSVPHLTVGVDGSLYVASSQSLAVLRISRDAANPEKHPTFGPGEILPLGSLAQFGDTPNPGGFLGQAWLATDHSETELHGNVYALASAGGTNSLDVHFIRSEDGGATWTDYIRVDDDAPDNGARQWFAMMSVAPNGRIDAAWNDTRNSGDPKVSELYYSFSTNGGRSWALNVPVSLPFNTWIGWPQNAKIGDYYHMVSDNLGVNIAYAATFNNEQDIYFLRIGPYDCNGNETADETDIADETSLDCNENGVPDECEYRADYDGDGLTSLADYAEFVRCQHKPRPPIHPDPYGGEVEGWARPTLRDRSIAQEREPADLFDLESRRAGTEGLYAARGVLGCCGLFDIEPDGDIDLADFAFLQRAFNSEE